jgi:hypothetical protein
MGADDLPRRVAEGGKCGRGSDDDRVFEARDCVVDV